MNHQEIVRKVLDIHLLPDIPYNLVVIEIGGTWYVNVEILVDSSKYHRAAPNYDADYQNKFLKPILKIVNTALDLLGEVAFLNSLSYKKINIGWLDDLENKIDIAISDFFYSDSRLRGFKPNFFRIAEFEYDKNSPAIAIRFENLNGNISKKVYSDLGLLLLKELNLADFMCTVDVRHTTYKSGFEFTLQGFPLDL